MPLSEAEREVLDHEGNGHQLPVHIPSTLGWIDVVYQLWSQRRQIARWAFVGLVLSSIVAWRYPKYDSTAQIMPPDSGNSGLASLVPALSKAPGLIGMAGDLMGVKSTGAVFAKVLESRTVEDHLIDRFDLQTQIRRELYRKMRARILRPAYHNRGGQKERRYQYFSALIAMLCWPQSSPMRM